MVNDKIPSQKDSVSKVPKEIRKINLEYYSKGIDT